MALPSVQPAAPFHPPRHVAVIMDGNGRWAAARGMPRIAGHRAGTQAVRRTIEAAIREGVAWLTLYAFSSENWRRPAEEVSGLTGLMRHYLRQELQELHREGVRLRVLGEPGRFEGDVAAELATAERVTAGNTRLNLNMALSYGARDEIVGAMRAAAAAARAGTLDPGEITEETVSGLLTTAGMPDPDLVIRTSGERRLSNFLLWQSAYAELVFVDTLWPDFGGDEFRAALDEYAKRERRFGARPG